MALSECEIWSLECGDLLPLFVDGVESGDLPTPLPLPWSGVGGDLPLLLESNAGQDWR
jgi:hypothetical protein